MPQKIDVDLFEKIPLGKTEAETNAFIAGYDAAFDWISVKDRLPKEGHNVLVFVEDTGWIETAHTVTDCISNELRWTNHTKVTHWMPLPNPPKI